MRQFIEHDGERYDLIEATQDAAIRDLRDLHKAAGLSVTSIARALIGMRDVKSPLEVFDDIDRLDAFAAMLFLCKRKAGHTVGEIRDGQVIQRPFSWDDAIDVPMSRIHLVFEVDDEEVEEDDPKDQPTPAEQDDEGEPTTA